MPVPDPQDSGERLTNLQRLCDAASVLPGALDAVCEALTCLVVGCATTTWVEPSRFPVLMSFYPSYESRRAQLSGQNWMSAWLPHFRKEWKSTFKTPTAVWGGADDRLARPELVEDMVELINATGALVDAHMFDAGHLELLAGKAAGATVGARLVTLMDEVGL